MIKKYVCVISSQTYPSKRHNCKEIILKTSSKLVKSPLSIRETGTTGTFSTYQRNKNMTDSNQLYYLLHNKNPFQELGNTR